MSKVGARIAIILQLLTFRDLLLDTLSHVVSQRRGLWFTSDVCLGLLRLLFPCRYAQLVVCRSVAGSRTPRRGEDRHQ